VRHVIYNHREEKYGEESDELDLKEWFVGKVQTAEK
jgi:hypothetical protein